MNTIKLVLFKIRRDRNILLQELAERLNITKERYSRIERGLDAPFPGFVARVANTLNLSQKERVFGAFIFLYFV